MCASPLVSRAAAVEGTAILFAIADLEVVAPEKALDAQQMVILQRDLPARFDTEASGVLSLRDVMTLALTAFEARTDMIERTRVASNADPKVLRVKTP